ncbi:hypothetical protein MMMB2_5105 [Mycobacterium marinum MB2]|nr:hypothetical protein MMMB2_5105 [Mycobacterium marinum MB2]
MSPRSRNGGSTFFSTLFSQPKRPPLAPLVPAAALFVRPSIPMTGGRSNGLPRVAVGVGGQTTTRGFPIS